jgi:hypothetical protein
MALVAPRVLKAAMSLHAARAEAVVVFCGHLMVAGCVPTAIERGTSFRDECLQTARCHDFSISAEAKIFVDATRQLACYI